MRILIVGGTQFIGRAIAETALERGHHLTLFHRGRTGPDLFPEATHLHGDRDRDLSALEQGEWDATVDTCAYVPRQVLSLADVLGERAGRYALISSVSAHEHPAAPGAAEDSPLVELDDPTTETVNAETYGGLKVLCERAALEQFGPGTLLIRPTYVIGPHDPTGRFTHWVVRLAEGGEGRAPAPPESPIQLVDARDLGDFTVGLLERGASGPVIVATPRPPYSWGDMLETIAATVAPPGTSIRWVDPASGRFPLWSDTPNGFALDPSRAYDLGLRARPLQDTVRDTLAWARE
jgi:2'-hydroxyisoflavone reductase